MGKSRVADSAGGAIPTKVEKKTHKKPKRSFLGITEDDSEGEGPRQVPLQLLKVENYGSIRFPGSSQPPAKWVRLETDQAGLPDKYASWLTRMMLETWNLPPPSALISVLGPWKMSSEPILDKAYISTFKEALVNLSRTSKAWIFTRGLSDEVVSLVGRAMEDSTSKTPCIGFAPWSLVAENLALSRKAGEMHYYRTGKAIVAPASETQQQFPLDPCHSHFLLVDNGSTRLDAAREVRTKLRHYISENDVSDNDITTPVLSLVLNGDITTMRVILSAVKTERSPVVLLTETGGAAGLLYEYMSAGVDAEGREHFLQQLKARGGPWADEPDVPSLLREIIAHNFVRRADGSEKHLLSFVKLADLEGDDLEGLMREALLCGCRSQQDELMLAVSWGDRDVLSQLLQNEAEWGRAQGEAVIAKRLGKGLALESALNSLDETVVSCLIDFAAEAAYVRPAMLFDRSKIKYDKRSMHAHLWATKAEAVEMEASFTRARDTRALLPADRMSKPSQKWMKILSALVDGYDYHLNVRASKPKDVKPTWTDLMMWAVLIGETSLAHTLWRKSRMPLRAACLASQTCSHLSKDPRNAPDADELAESAAMYEQWALDLLDAMPEDQAHALLVLVRCVAKGEETGAARQPLWGSSAFDSATEDNGKLSVACKELVSHKHAISLAECYFCGDYFGSKARIAEEATWLAIFVQVFLPFLPGTVCEVFPSSWPTKSKRRLARTSRNTRKSGPTLSEAEGEKSTIGEDEEPEDWAVRFKARKEFLQQVADHESDTKDALEDVAHDLRSGRVLYFYAIPKVKFLIHQIFYLCYILLLPYILVTQSAPSEVEWALPDSIMRLETVYWAWSAALFIGELEQLYSLIPADNGYGGCGSRLREGVDLYLSDAWNVGDLAANTLIALTVALRLAATDDTAAQTWARATYAIVIVLQWLRLLQSLRISKSVGVLSIVLGRMITKDIFPFFILFLIVSPAFGLALCVLDPSALRGEPDQLEPTQATVFRYLDSSFWQPWFALTAGFDMDGYIEAPKGIVAIEWLMPLLALLYELFAIVVVLNLLIAAMGATFAELDEKAKVEWQYERVQLIREYKDQKMFPAPLNVLHLLWRLLAALFRFILGRPPPVAHQHGFQMQVSQAEELFLQAQELEALKQCALKHESNKHESEIQSRIEGRIEQMMRLVESKFEKLANANRAALLSPSPRPFVPPRRHRVSPELPPDLVGAATVASLNGAAVNMRVQL